MKTTPFTPAQRGRRERSLLAEHAPRTLAGEPRLSRYDEQEIADQVRAAETATRERQLVEHAARIARAIDELAAAARSMREHNLIDRRAYSIIDRDIRSLAATQRRLSVPPIQ